MTVRMLKPRIATADLRTVKPLVDQGTIDRKKFYDSALWQHTRRAKLNRDPLCQRCAYLGSDTPSHHVDHWVALAKGGHPTADENLVALCSPCHSVKTQAETKGEPLFEIAPSKARTFHVA